MGIKLVFGVLIDENNGSCRIYNNVKMSKIENN